jgi:hypothetical protein
MLQFARCASTIDGNLSEGHALLGAICLMKKSYDEAVRPWDARDRNRAECR